MQIKLWLIVVLGLSSVILVTGITLLVLWKTKVLWHHPAPTIAPSPSDTACTSWSSFGFQAELDTTTTGVLVGCNSKVQHVINLDTSTLKLSLYQAPTYHRVAFGNLGATLGAIAAPAVSDSGTRVAALTFDGRCRVSQGTLAQPFANPVTITQKGVQLRHLQFDRERLCLSGLTEQGRGGIYIYEGTTLVQTILPSNRADNDYFGLHFAINGPYLIASCPLRRVAEVYLRTNFGAPFVLVAIIDPKKPKSESFFPYRVAISSDGSWAVLSNPMDLVQNKKEAGSLCLAIASESAYAISEAAFVSPHVAAKASFGAALSLWDNQFLVVSEFGFGPTEDKGQGYVYRWENGGLTLHTELSGAVSGRNEEAPFAASTGIGLYGTGELRIVAGQPNKDNTAGHVWYWSSSCLKH